MKSVLDFITKFSTIIIIFDSYDYQSFVPCLISFQIISRNFQDKTPKVTDDHAFHRHQVRNSYQMILHFF